MVRHNNVVPNQHFKKKWQFNVRTWFNQPARALRRRKGESEVALARAGGVVRVRDARARRWARAQDPLGVAFYLRCMSEVDLGADPTDRARTLPALQPALPRPSRSSPAPRPASCAPWCTARPSSTT